MGWEWQTYNGGLIVPGSTQTWRQTPADDAAQRALAYQQSGISNINASIGSAQNALGLAQDVWGTSQPYMQNAADAAGQMGGAVDAVRGSAAQVQGMGAALLPYMDTLGGYGDSLWGQGLGLFGQGQGILGTGQGILGLDASMGGLGGEMVKWLQSLDPGNMVSMAAADAQTAWGNAQGQMDRSLARSGVDAGSARSAAMRQQAAQSLAALLAGTKTQARMMGLSNYGAALKDALGSAESLLQTGAGLTGQGLNAQTAAGQMQQGAANVGGQAGSLFAQAGQLEGQAGSLLAQQSNAYAQLGTANAQMANALVNAANGISSAQANAANYYAQLAGSMGAMVSPRTMMENLFPSNSGGRWY